MYQRAVKILFFIVIMWLVSLFTVLHEFSKTKKIHILQPEELKKINRKMYERALDRFKGNFVNKSLQSRFEVWEQMPSVNLDVSSAERRLIISNADDNEPGMNGKPVYLENHLKYYLKELVKKGWEDHAFNQFVSDLIPSNRTLPDERHSWCKSRNYTKNLSKATVIICFHNEAWSTLLRTIHSVLNRTPPHLLSEIILFDDYSTMAHLKAPLGEYVRIYPKLILLRALRREGLIRARILSTRHASAPVVVFLDSHCECAEGWLEPLLERINENPTTVVSPTIDHIHSSTFEYIAQDINNLQIGGFNWNLQFTWSAIPREVLVKRKNPAAPIATPTISGGIFAINHLFFKRLGYYDMGYKIWGAENLELSFKTWMCGGTLEIIPCSHVGHVFRKRVPYKGEHDSLRTNLMRLAEVWLDKYAKYYYQRMGNYKPDIGNITNRKELRKSLKCKTFEWYLKNVYPQLEIPDNYVASGQIYSLSNYGMCLDANTAVNNYQETIHIMPCHFEGGNQFWIYTRTGEIRRDSMCLDYLYNMVTLHICGGRVSSQVWLYDSHAKNIRHMLTQTCLQIAKFENGLKLVLAQCLSNYGTQKWVMDNYNINNLSPELQMYSKRKG